MALSSGDELQQTHQSNASFQWNFGVAMQSFSTSSCVFPEPTLIVTSDFFKGFL